MITFAVAAATLIILATAGAFVIASVCLLVLLLAPVAIALVQR
jgi:hypothetical protein